MKMKQVNHYELPMTLTEFQNKNRKIIHNNKVLDLTQNLETIENLIKEIKGNINLPYDEIMVPMSSPFCKIKVTYYKRKRTKMIK